MKAKIKEILFKEYGIELNQLTVIPRGMVGSTYSITDTSGEKYFLKIWGESRLSEIALHKIDNSLKTNYNLYHTHHITSISCPIKTKSKKLSTKINSNILAVYKFIEGKDVDHWTLNKNQLKSLAELLSSIHNLPTNFKIPVENFDIWFKSNLIKSLNDLDKHKKLKTTIMPVKDIILKRLKELEDIQKEVKKLKTNYVLCHTDPINLMYTNNKVYLVDWDDMKLAPREHDMWFFLEDYGKSFLDEYKKHTKKLKLNIITISHYMYMRVLDDLTDWLLEILYGNHIEEQNENSLKEIKQYCIPFIQKLPERIEKIESLL